MYIFYYIPNFTGGLADFHLVKEIIEDTESRMCLFPKRLNKTDAREMVVFIHAMGKYYIKLEKVIQDH